MTKIDLITGLLGSGKTTFLLHYARYLLRQGERIAILENDFGAVNVDMVMLQELKGENCELGMIAGGCDAHCHRRRFKTQLINLGMQHFDRVLVEPSGIFDMDEFFDTLHESPLDRWFEIGSVLTVVDAQTDDELPPQMEYLFGSEAACAGKLILSKWQPEIPAETAAASALTHLNRSLEAIRCDRRFTAEDMLVRDWETLTDADFVSLKAAGYRGSAYIKRFRPEDILSSVHYFMHIHIPDAQIRPVIQAILEDPACGRIYRLKGSLPAPDGWYKINATPETTAIDPVPDGQAVLIVIGDGLHREAIDRHLQQVNTDPAYVSV
ncbi:MAG: GTPase (G3E family) [Oscillospiraceae bacterium]|nr:GTPase (G3E family) [Oscillospiraceae bacterium]